jgi:hypothetical protein
VRGLSQGLLPEALLGLPQVGSLPGEGGAMHPHKVREEVGVVPAGKYAKGSASSPIPRDSPTTSMVRTSEPASVGAGPRALRRPRPASWSLMRQKTATTKVPRSTRAGTSFSLR